MSDSSRLALSARAGDDDIVVRRHYVVFDIFCSLARLFRLRGQQVFEIQAEIRFDLPTTEILKKSVARNAMEKTWHEAVPVF